MADLLSSAQHAKIRSAINDVFDTFADTVVSYYLGQDKIDDYMEDLDGRTYTQIDFNAVVEYMKTDEDKVTITNEGRVDMAEIKLTVGFDHLEGLGLTSNDSLIMRPEEDYFIVNGEKFITIFAAIDGPFESKNVAAVIYGKRDIKEVV